MSISSSCRVTDDLHHGAHAAARAAPPARKSCKRLHEIVRPLPGQPGALALAGEIRLVTAVAMALRQERRDLFRVDGDVALGGEGGRRRQRGVVGAEVADIVVGQVLDDRLHDPGIAGAVAHEDQLVLGEDVRLAGQRRRVLGGRNPLGAVAGGAGLGDGRRLDRRRGLGALAVDARWSRAARSRPASGQQNSISRTSRAQQDHGNESPRPQGCRGRDR